MEGYQDAPYLEYREATAIFEVAVARLDVRAWQEASTKVRSVSGRERNLKTIKGAMLVAVELALRVQAGKPVDLSEQTLNEIAERTNGYSVSDRTRTRLIEWFVRWQAEQRGLTEPSIPDPELGPHQRELFYFGERLRDRLFRPDLITAAGAGTEAGDKRLWRGRPTPPGSPHPHDAEEERVEESWSPRPFDARTHVLFSPFQEHLIHDQCWTILNEVEVGVHQYRFASQKAYLAVLRQVTNAMPELGEGDLGVMTESLLWDGYFRSGEDAGYSFAYSIIKSPVDDKSLCLELAPNWKVGHGMEQSALFSMAEGHRELARSLPTCFEVRAVRDASRCAQQAIGRFREALSYPRLRKLILAGRCWLCR